MKKHLKGRGICFASAWRLASSLWGSWAQRFYFLTAGVMGPEALLHHCGESWALRFYSTVVGSRAEHSSSYGKGRERRECGAPSLSYPSFIPHTCPANGTVQPTFKEGFSA